MIPRYRHWLFYNFFARFDIDMNFHQLEIKKWSKTSIYLKALTIVKNLRVINDTAERAVKFTEGCINIVARHKDENQSCYSNCKRIQKISNCNKTIIWNIFIIKLRTLFMYIFWDKFENFERSVDRKLASIVSDALLN